MIAVVTGASGYTGNRLVHTLVRHGVEVHALLRPGSDAGRLPPEAVVHRLTQPVAAVLASLGPASVYHLAAPSGAAALAELNQWIGFSLDLLDGVAAVPGSRFVLAGSWWQYDSHGLPRPCTVYAAAKQAVQGFLDHYAGFHGLSACTAILFDIYGPGDWRRKMVPMLINAQGALPATEGHQQMDLIHVDDVVAGLLACAAAREDNGAGLYTLGSSQRLSVRQLAGMVGRLRGRPLAMRWGELPMGVAPVMPCPADRPPPGWRAEIALEDGLEQVIAHG